MSIPVYFVGKRVLGVMRNKVVPTLSGEAHPVAPKACMASLKWPSRAILSALLELASVVVEGSVLYLLVWASWVWQRDERNAPTTYHFFSSNP